MYVRHSKMQSVILFYFIYYLFILAISLFFYPPSKRKQANIFTTMVDNDFVL